MKKPINEFRLVSNTELDFLVAADSIDYLLQYEVYSHWRCAYHERAQAHHLLEQKVVYFLDANIRVAVLECKFMYAQVKLLQESSGKKKGDVCWVYQENIAAALRPPP
jgi:hypothetical protein